METFYSLPHARQRCFTARNQLLKNRILSTIFLLAAGIFGVVSVSAASSLSTDKPRLFRAGFLTEVFTITDPRDVKAVLELHCEEVARSMEVTTTSEVILFPSLESMIVALKNQQLEMVSMPSIDYLKVRETIPLIPSFVGIRSVGPGIDYVLITRNDSGIRSLADLKSKSLLLPQASRYEPAHVWLDVLIKRIGETDRDKYFGYVRELNKVSSAIMEVFFGQADAAIVTRHGLSLAQELNPQMQSQLLVLLESPNLSDSVVSLLPNMPDKFQNDAIQAMHELSDSKTGRQLFTIFRSRGIAPFIPEYLMPLEALLEEQRQLNVKMALVKK